MTMLSWLHVSDWHQRGKDFDRQVLRDALLTDIEERDKIDRSLNRIDFVIFSGDIAFSGQAEEYDAAWEYLFLPLLETVDLDADRLFVIPGNHDVDWDTFYLLPSDLVQPFRSDVDVKRWLTDRRGKLRLLAPFENYQQFMIGYLGVEDSAYNFIRHFTINGRRISLLGLNSALMSGRNKNGVGEVNDYGYLIVGEPQIHDALSATSGADIKITVMHHPFDWLSEFDRIQIEHSLVAHSHFILLGHRHLSKVEQRHGTDGDCIIIPGGSSFGGRVPDMPHYTNAYNFVSLDLDTGRGTVFLRHWNERRRKWAADIDTYDTGTFPFSLPGVPRITRDPAGEIAPVGFDPDIQNKSSEDIASTYLARFSSSTSKRTMSDSLNRIAHLLSRGEETALTFDWSSVAREDTRWLYSHLMDSYAPKSVSKMLVALRGVLGTALRLGRISLTAYKEAVDFPPVKIEKRPTRRRVQADEIDRLFSVCSEDKSAAGIRDLAIIVLLYVGRLRRSQIVALNTRDYDARGKILTVKSSNSTFHHSFELTQKSAAALDAWLSLRGKSIGPVFYPINKSGQLIRRRMSDTAVRKILQKRAKQAGIAQVTPNDLRFARVADIP